MAITFIKLDIGIFQNPKIQRMDRFSAADMYFRVYVAILCMAMKSHITGVLMISENLPADAMDIARFCNKTEAQVKEALSVFRKLNMISFEDETVLIPSFEEHQNTKRIKESRENTRLRMQKYREKQRSLIGVTRNGTAKLQHVTQRDLDLDKDIDKDKEKNGEPLTGAALLLKIIIDLRKDGTHGGIPVTPKENGKPKYTPAHARLYGKAARFKLEAIAEADGTDLAGRVFKWAAGDKFWGAQELHAGNYERYKAGFTASENGAGEDPLIKSMRASAEILGGNDGT